MTNHAYKACHAGEYAEYPVDEIKKLYLCRAAYEKTLLRFEALKAENNLLKAEINRLNKLLNDDSPLVS